MGTCSVVTLCSDTHIPIRVSLYSLQTSSSVFLFTSLHLLWSSGFLCLGSLTVSLQATKDAITTLWDQGSLHSERDHFSKVILFF